MWHFIFWRKYLSFSPLWVIPSQRGTKFILAEPNFSSFWDCKLPNIVILYWGHMFLFMCTELLFLVHTVLLMVFVTWFVLLSRTNTGTRSQITQHYPKPKCRLVLNPKNKVQSLLVHQNMPDIQTRAVSAQNMGQSAFSTTYLISQRIKCRFSEFKYQLFWINNSTQINPSSIKEKHYMTVTSTVMHWLQKPTAEYMPPSSIICDWISLTIYLTLTFWNGPAAYTACPESNETDFLWPSRRVGERSLRAWRLVGDVR